MMVKAHIQSFAPHVIDLQGRWRFRQRGKGPWLPAQVPGSVQSDLLRLGKIKDPYVYPNEAKCQWIENVGWEYCREIQLSKRDLARDGLELVFDGLDTYATVYLNGHELVRTDNMHRPYVLDIKRWAKVGANELRVVFAATLPRARRESKRHYYLPSRTDVTEVVPWIRKGAYQFGWDWCPRLVTSGIWRPARLIAFDKARIRGAITQQHWQGKDVRLAVCVRLRVAAEGLMILRARVAGVEVEKTLSLRPGTREATLEVTVKNPRLWWSNGLGRQHRYPLTVTAECGGVVVDRIQKHIGFRTVKLVQKKDKAGSGFYFEVNGVPVWAKGGNWVPLDSLPDRAATAKGQARTRDLLKSCADAHMNMIRVWGGGVYEIDAFYDACDELGLLVFQDFMYGCHQYPGTAEFLENARVEAEEQIWRLADHPSLALWCGNNEIEQGWAYWGWRESMPERFADFITLFCRLLPGVVKKLDPARPYRACSESSGPPYGRHPKDPRVGDVHYWGVTVRQEPIEKYEELKARFVAEFGFIGFPDWASLRAVIPPKQLRLGSAAIEDRMKWPTPCLRPKNPHGNRVLGKYLTDYTGIPAGVDKVGRPMERLVYLSQMLQGFAIQTAVEAWRRFKPYCMGALYWQINSCWPEIGWASLGYEGRWKGLHHMAARFFGPVLASAAVKAEGKRAELWVTSDVNEPLAGKLDWELRGFDGQVRRRGRAAVKLRALENKRIAVVAVDDDPRDVYLCYRFMAGRLRSENVKFFARFKDLRLKPTQVRAQVRSSRRGELAVELKADGPAFFVYLDQGDLSGRFADNFLHLEAGKARTVRFLTQDPRAAARLKKTLKVHWL
ncbi:MAG: glycoside hydrolase family 2 protein [Phycisphaeraceae bacterium]|nr:glycoside hydrolase family 2 protein [Phycisphaeraceae bacterium]